MAGHGEKKSRRREQAVEALLSTPTVEAAAARAKVGVRTLTRWLNEDETFKRMYRQARRRLVERAISTLQRVSNAAATVLAVELQSDRAADRIRAACEVLDRAVGGIELLDLAERLDDIEKRLDEIQNMKEASCPQT